MKKITIGEEVCYVLEGIDEMNYKRSLLFNQWSALVFEELNHSLFELAVDRIKHHFNNGDYFSMLNEIINNQFLTRLKEPNIDALGRCFALICLTEDEKEKESDASTWDDNSMKEKIDRWSAAGLSLGVMVRHFEDFLKASPNRYLPFLERLQMMAVVGKMLDS